MTELKPNENVTVVDNTTGKQTTFPLLSGTAGAKVIDIRNLYKDLGYFTFDPGYTATGSCESKITYIAGDEGVLLYRGYPIAQLAEQSDFMAVRPLLLCGELRSEESGVGKECVGTCRSRRSTYQ